MINISIKRVRVQLILGITLVLLLMMTIFVADLARRQSAFLHTQCREQALGLANDLAVNAQAHVTADDLNGLERLVQTYQQFPHLEYAMVLSPDNVVLAHTDSSYQGKVAADSVSRGIGKEVRGHVLASDDHLLDVAVPMLHGKTVIGWARVGLNQDYIVANLATMIRNGVLYLLIALVLGSLVALVIVNRLTAGLYRLVDAAEKIRGGDRSLRVPQTGSFEIARLAIAFNRMLDEIISHESELESVFQNTEGALSLLNVEKRYVIYNRQFIENHRQLTGREPITGDFVYSDFPPEIRMSRHQLLEAVLKGEKVVVEPEYTIEGRRRYFRTSFNPIIVGGKVTGISTYTMELTENKEAEIALRESEEKFRTLVEQSQVGVYILQDGKFIYVNPGFEKVTGYSREEAQRQLSIDLLIHEEDLAFVRRKYEARMSGEQPTDHYEARAIRRDGSVIWIEIIASTIIYNHRRAVIGSLIDITPRLQEENRINKAVIAAQESERMQIGMELHDNVQQIMAGSLLAVDYVKNSLDDRPLVLETLDNIKEYLNECIVELRRLSHQLAPSMQRTEKLKDKIEGLVENMNRGRLLDVEIAVDEFDGPLDDEVQLALYRIVQEQFSNVLKYAEASRVWIGIRQADRRMVLSIRDNGKGFDPATNKQGIGLENIRRRSTAMDGDLKILSAEGKGCEVMVQVPY